MNNTYLTFADCAKKWEEALPIGNGSLGAMVYGKESKEIIQLNEETLWSGKPLDDSNFDVKEHLPVARKLIDEGKTSQAEEYINENMLGHWTQNYLPLGNLMLDFKHNGPIKNYQRRLDLMNGISSLSYEHEGVTYEREYFCSKVDDLMVVHIKASRFGDMNCYISMDSFLKHKIETPWDHLKLVGEAPVHVDPVYDSKEQPVIYDEDDKGIEFASIIKVDSDGIISTNNNDLFVQHASYMTLFVACKTNFIDPFTRPNSDIRNPLGLCNNSIEKAMAKGYKQLKEDHMMDFSKLMNRVELNIESHEGDSDLTTKEHIMSMKQNENLDADLVQQLFQFGRYLTVSSSREGTHATNLQGIWNSMLQAPWCSNYTININTQMNYWPVDVTNLSECYSPLINLIKDLAVSGVDAAKALGCRGWTANHNTDLWRQTIQVRGSAQFAFWPFGGPWLTTHLFEHYRYNQDLDYLRDVYPIIKESAKFCLDWGYIDDSGYIVTSPSTSPENNYLTPNGESCSVTKASAMDMTIMWQVFTDCIHSISLLEIEDKEFESKLMEARDKLYPYKINNEERINEWWDERTYRDEGHRHVSHLCGLYPNHRVNCDDDHELMTAHHKSLEDRIANGGGHTSWSCAWVMLLYARLRDKNRAKDMIMKYFKNSLITNGLSSHPPFQIDGNFGFTAAISEMLIQSHNDYIEILPSLPDELESGSFTGLKVRGGYEVGAKWKNNKVYEITIKAMQDGLCQLKLNGDLREVACKKDVYVQVDCSDMR